MNSDDVGRSLRELGVEGYLDFPNVFFGSFHDRRNLSYFPSQLYIYCRTCAQRWHAYECLNPSTCVQEMLALYREALAEGKAVQWRFKREHKLYSKSELRNAANCSFWSVKCTIADETLMHFQVLAGPFNLTYESPYPVSTAFVSEYEDLFPSVKLNMLEFLGYKSEFRFITADGVSAEFQSGLLSFLWRPLLSAVWIMTLLSILAFAGLYASVLPSVESCMLTHYVYVLELSCVLTGHSFGINDRNLHAWKRCAYNMLALTWLLSAVLISAAYGAMFSSNYIASPIYKTKWTKLEQLENFTFYFGYEKGSGSQNVWLSNTTGLVVHKKGYFGLRVEDVAYAASGTYSFLCPGIGRLIKRSACNTLLDQLGPFTDAGEVKGDLKYVQWWHRYRNLFLNIVMRAEFYDVAKSEETILGNLVGPKTAVVTPLECFEQDWAVFQKVTSETGTQFGHNLHVDDGFFRKPRYYMTSDGLGKEHGKIMHRRLRGFMQSGLYGFWKKWDKFKDKLTVKQGGRKHKEPETLAFENSEIGGPFHVLGIGIASSLVGFLLEIFLKTACI